MNRLVLEKIKSLNRLFREIKFPANTIFLRDREIKDSRNAPRKFSRNLSPAKIKENKVFSGPAQRKGLAGGWAQGLPTFWKKKLKKYTFSNERNLWWNKNIRLADLAKAYKFMIGPFRSCIIMASFKMSISTNLHLVVDFCVFTSQVM